MFMLFALSVVLVFHCVTKKKENKIINIIKQVSSQDQQRDGRWGRLFMVRYNLYGTI